MSTARPLRACHACSLVHEVPRLEHGQVARCTRCGARVADADRPGRRAAKAWHAATAALLLYPVAVSLPILRIERLGQVHESSVWSGCVGLIADGKAALGLVVFVCSIVVPLAKLATLFVLLRRAPAGGGGERRAVAWRVLEATGRFGMLDVLLVSILVAWLELGALVSVTAGPAAAAFGGCVLLSLLASWWFDPHDL